MNAKEFFDLTARMREAQKRFFKSRSSLDLRESKKLEAEIDAEIKRVNTLALHEERQTALFGDDKQYSET